MGTGLVGTGEPPLFLSSVSLRAAAHVAQVLAVDGVLGVLGGVIDDDAAAQRLVAPRTERTWHYGSTAAIVGTAVTAN